MKRNRHASFAGVRDHTKINILKKTHPLDVENMLHYLSKDDKQRIHFRLPRQSSSAFFSDIWVAALMATAVRHSRTALVHDWWDFERAQSTYSTYLVSDIRPLAAALIVGEFKSQDGQPIPFTRTDLVATICAEAEDFVERGLLKEAEGLSRTICEFDPEMPLAGQFGGGQSGLTRADQRTLFRQAIVQMRSSIEHAARRRGVQPVDEGPMRHLTSFLTELHDNSCEYGHHDENNKNLTGFRILRLKKHIGSNKEEFIKRASYSDLLSAYIRSSSPDRTHMFIEASISDFGLGVLDYFLHSTGGQSYRDDDRRVLLLRIVQEKLSTKKADPGAGWGISNALLAAKQMKAFVSLRTGEFWWAWFADTSSTQGEQEYSLRDMLPGKKLSKIAGTHWQIIYHQNV